MKKTIMIACITALFFSVDASAATPSAEYSFEGSIDNATAIEREEYYSDAGLVTSDGASFTYTEGMAGQCLYMNGYEALKFPITMNTESYTVSYWIKPDRITNCTPTLMITPTGFEAEKFINITLAVDNLSPNVWTHTMFPADERTGTGMPGLLTPGQWTYVTMVVDENMSPSLLEEYGVFPDENSSGVALYINGWPVACGRTPKGMCTDTTEYWFGVNIWDDLYAGCVDELSFFDSALSETEVKELYLAAGGDPDADKPVGSTNPNGGDFNWRPNGGSVSDEYIPNGTTGNIGNHLNLDNASPLTTQGTDRTTNAYSDIAALLAFGLILLSVGMFLQYNKQKKNCY